MKITKEDLKARFDEYNRLYFGSALPRCEFSVTKLSCLGRYMFSSGKNGKRKYRIRLTSDVNWTEETLRDVLIHEMIHHYVVAIDGCKGIDGFSWYSLFGHGKRFRRQVRRIKRKYGLKIHIHGDSNLYHKNERVPTTRWGKFVRRIYYNLT
jgi:hypothetical protein